MECIKIRILFSMIFVATFALATTNPSTKDHWSVTQLKFINTEYTWTIRNFSLYGNDASYYFESPIFSSEHDNNLNWSLRMYPTDKGAQGEDWVSVFLLYKSGDIPQSEIKIDGQISILNATFDVILSNKGKLVPLNVVIDRHYVLNNSNGVLRNDELTVFTDFTVTTGMYSISSDCKVRNQSLEEQQFSDHLERFLENPEYSDVILIVKGSEIPAHKLILSARSTVFAAILKNYAKDPIQPGLVITDVDINVMKEVLRYMYTGRVQNLDKIAKELLSAASIYDIEGLKDLSQEKICKSLNFDNAIDILLLADRNKAETLKSKAINFIVAHIADFVHTPAFKALEQSHPDLITEIFKAMVDNRFN